MEQVKGVPKAGENVFLHGEDGPLVWLKQNAWRLVFSSPQTVESDETTIAIGRHDGPTADVQRRCSLVVHFDPILRWFNGVVVAVRQDLGDGQVG